MAESIFTQNEPTWLKQIINLPFNTSLPKLGLIIVAVLSIVGSVALVALSKDTFEGWYVGAFLLILGAFLLIGILLALFVQFIVKMSKSSTSKEYIKFAVIISLILNGVIIGSGFMGKIGQGILIGWYVVSAIISMVYWLIVRSSLKDILIAFTGWSGILLTGLIDKEILKNISLNVFDATRISTPLI